MIIEKKKLSELRLSDYNPRIHTSEFLDRLRKSIDHFGYIDPIIWNKRTGNIVGGHARYKILKEKGIEEAEVVVVDLDNNDEKLLNLQLNKNMGEWDEIQLSTLLNEIKLEEVNIDLSGFSEIEIAKFTHVFDEVPDEIQRLDIMKLIICPNCGHEIKN